ncbi:MAG: DUF4381 domain-containing protein [Muribaculaceae bacterium]|nr:DUF4381 domain-containing protein [Muribaculaceae bacterium]
MITLNSLKKYTLSILLAASAFSSGEAAPIVKARLDSSNVMMGTLSKIELTVEQQPGVKGRLPIFQNVAEKGYVGVCGDSVELRAPSSIDTTDAGKNMLIRYEIPVQSFDSGYYRLPAFEYVAGVDTFRSNRLELKVYPFPNVTAETPIADYANVADPENKSIFDTLPDWLVDYWWVILLVISAAVLGWWLWRRYRKEGHILPKKPEPTPYEAALAALRDLKAKKLWENGMEKEYFTDLTDILRTYLYRRFGINAMEMTSRQILAALSSNKETKDKRPMIRQILDMADFVKFAKVRPLPADNVASFENAEKFIEETKPVEKKEEEDATGNPSNDRAAGKKNGNKKGGGK